MISKVTHQAEALPHTLPAWEVLGEAISKMRQAESIREILQWSAQALSQLGFLVITGEINKAQTKFYTEFVSYAPNRGKSNQASILNTQELQTSDQSHPKNFSIPPQNNARLQGKGLALSSLGISQSIFDDKAIDLITIKRQALDDIFNPSIPWGTDKDADLQAPKLLHRLYTKSSIVAIGAALQPSLPACKYLFLVMGDDISPTEITTIAAFREITEAMIENRSLDQQIQKQEQHAQRLRNDAILESTTDAIIIISADGSIEHTNPAFTKLTGYALAEVARQSFDLLISEETPKQKVQQMWSTIQAGKTWRGDLKNRRKDDSLYDAALTISPIFDAAEKIDKFVAIQRDISKQIELDRLKDEFLVTMNHELKTPLSSIIGYTELLLGRHFAKSESDLFLKNIQEQANRMVSLVQDFLDVSRKKGGAAFFFRPQLLNPASIFQNAATRWQQKTNRTFVLSQPETWPEINVDPDQLKLVLDKLLSNAVKYSAPDSQITVTVETTLTNLRVSIEDQGVGLTLDEQKHLFERFWRADASYNAEEGAGLSMVVVKSKIEDHGGKIWVSSQRGVGTTVNFTLPLINGKSTILIIEDDPGIVAIESRILETQGHHVLVSQSGQKGLELAASQYPDLIILDLMLPGIEGEDVLHKLKESPTTNAIPVVVVSAKSGLANIEYAFALGAADFLTKPFDLDEFVKRIKIALSDKRMYL